MEKKKLIGSVVVVLLLPTLYSLMMDLFFSFPRERANKTAPIHSAAVDEKGASQELQKYSFSFSYYIHEKKKNFYSTSLEKIY